MQFRSRIGDKFWNGGSIGLKLMSGPKTQGQLFSHGESRFKIPAIDDSQTKSARWHGMILRRFLFMERDLNTGDLWRLPQLRDHVLGWMLIMHAMGAKQDDTVPFLSMGIIELPLFFGIQPNERFNPTGPVQIRPLVCKS